MYGTTSAPMDMKTCISAVGAWETVKIASAAIQMARYYNLPCRTGGSLTDAHCPDAQALAEGSMLLSTALRNGAHFILHACGQMGSFISMSFEKWLIDEETCALVRNALAPLEISASTIDIDTICDIGIGGNYLTHPSTFANFKNLSQPTLFNRCNNQRWIEKGVTDVAHIASSELAKRLDRFEAPPMDENLKQELKAYVVRRKQGWLKTRSFSYKHLKN